MCSWAPHACSPPCASLQFGPALLGHLQPWAAWVHTHTEPLPVLGMLGVDNILLLLAAAALLGTLRFTVDALRFVTAASEVQRGESFALLARLLLGWFDFPDSCQEVVTSVVVLLAARAVCNRLTALLPPPPPLAPGDAAVPAAAATPAAAAGAAAGRVRSEEGEEEGVRFEGYSEAIASAEAAMATGGEWLLNPRRGGPAAGLAQLENDVMNGTETAVQQLRASLAQQ